MGRRAVKSVEAPDVVVWPMPPLEQEAVIPERREKSEAEKWPVDPVFTGSPCYRCGQPLHQWHKCADLPGEWRPEPLYAVAALHITRMLLYTQGNKMAAARLLGLTMGKFKEKMRRYGIRADTGLSAHRPSATPET